MDLAEKSSVRETLACTCDYCLCVSICLLCDSVCLCNPAPVLKAARRELQQARRLCFVAPVSEPGALVFQRAHVGKRPAAPAVVPVGLALTLQSPGAAARRRGAAAGTGAARAAVLKHADL